MVRPNEFQYLEMKILMKAARLSELALAAKALDDKQANA
jgi:hypothetical protein